MPANSPNSDPAPRAKTSTGLAAYVQAERLMQIALLLPASVFIGWLGGVGLDRLFHQSWIAIAGILFGSISGMVGVVRIAMTVSNEVVNESASMTTSESANQSQTGNKLKNSPQNASRNDLGNDSEQENSGGES